MSDTSLSPTEPNGTTADGTPVPPLEGVTPVSPEGIEAVREIEAEGAAAAATDDAPAVKAPSEVPATGAAASGTSAGTVAVEDVEEALRDVVDPELGINVVDLGLVYGVTVDKDNHAVVDMTLTSAACPLTDVIEDQTAQALDGLVSGHRLNWVWMPPWGPDKITDDGREQLRALGFNI